MCHLHGMWKIRLKGMERWSVGMTRIRCELPVPCWREVPKLICLLIVFLVFASHPPARAGDQTKNDYRQARSCFEKLRKDSQKQKFRHHWIACIKRFQSVYAAQPNGPRADDALLMTGQLYAGLYGFSGRIRHENAVTTVQILQNRAQN